MKRKLTNTQRQIIKKWACLLLALSMLALSLWAVPYVARAIPRFGTSAPKTSVSAISPVESTLSLGAGRFETLELAPEITENDEESSPPTLSPGADDATVGSDNFCRYELGETPKLALLNSTKFSVSLADFLERTFPIKADLSDGPTVLIVHTHGTESYLANGYDFYSPSETFRSHDEADSVVHIGEVLKNELESLGIKTLHDRTMYDKGDYSGAYKSSYKGIQKAIKENPSIKFVIDLHRDSIFDTNGKNIKPLTTVDGEDCAQIMLVVGTNQGGAYHPNWRDNLTFAAHLQSKLNALYPTLARPVNLRSSSFNQALTKGSVILEVGSCGNTMEEAERAARHFAVAYAELLKEKLS